MRGNPIFCKHSLILGTARDLRCYLSAIKHHLRWRQQRRGTTVKSVRYRLSNSKEYFFSFYDVQYKPMLEQMLAAVPLPVIERDGKSILI